MKLPAAEPRRAPVDAVPASLAQFLATEEGSDLATTLAAGLERVEERLRAEVAYADEVARVTTTYLMNAGGKRMRPMLTILASMLAQDGEQTADSVIAAASAVELTHLASLYHDDVMDEAELRRGVPAAQLNWGNSIAILAGDLLFARASHMFAKLGQRCIELQAGTFERLVLGQLRETIGPKPEDDPITHYIEVLADKTGSLIAAAAQFGAITAGAPEEYVEPLANYGERIGVAFQIADDVIDLSPSSEVTGKFAGTDLRAGVKTLPVLLLEKAAETDAQAADLLERIRTRVAGVTAREPRDEHIAEVLAAPADAVVAAGAAAAEGHDAVDAGLAAREHPPVTEAEVEAIVAELRAHPVTQHTLDEAARWVEEAVRELDVLPEGPVREALVQFANSVVNRDH